MPVSTRTLTTLLLILAMILVGCGQGGQGEPAGQSSQGTASGEPGTEPQAAAAEVDELIIADTQGAATTLDPVVGRNTQSLVAAAQVLEPLLRRTFEGATLHPGLAESWDISEDGRVLTFHLQSGVKFQDGTPFNAQAVKFNFERARDLESRVWTLIGGPLIESIEAPDDLTVVFRYREVFADIPGVFGLEETGISSPAAIEEHGDDYGVTSLVGTGPFKFVQWVPSSEVVLERWEEYDRGSEELYGHTGPSRVKRLIFRGIPEAEARQVAVRTGAAQIASIARQFVQESRDNPDLEVYLAPKVGTSIMYLFNVVQGVASDPAVRQAFSHAIDREAVLQTPAYAGTGKVAYMPLASANWPGDPEVLKDDNYLYDPDRANELLDQAGWVLNPSTGIREKNGQELALKAVIFPDGVFDTVTAPVEGMLRDVGIKLDIVQGDLNFWISSLERGDFDVSMFSLTAPGWGPMYNMFVSDGVFNYGYQSPQADELAEQLSVTLDPAQRMELMEEWMRHVVRDTYAVPVIDISYPWVMRADLAGLTWIPQGFPYAYGIYRSR